MAFTPDMLIDTIKMFTFLMVELTLLFLAISYFVALLQEYIPPVRIQRILSDRHGKGYILAAFLGAITPFCSCSTIPFLKGLLRAKAGFGTTMVFLFASPLLNPIIIGIFAVTFGIKVALFYFTVALVISLVAGYTLEKLGFEKYIRADSLGIPAANSCQSSACGHKPPKSVLWAQLWKATWRDFKKVFPYLLAGIFIGSMIYGFVPTTLISSVASEDNLLAIPFAAVIGIPLYIRAEAVIPLSAALVAKGMGMGAVMALIIGSAGASLTEVILLKSLFKMQLITAFLVVILTMAITAGILYTLLL
ncbi:permease [Flexibacterium corallicola]|uniref:permease n=1 Tax=Flexibacterium corallicola TaxID=3037259 RepID=UPI00286F7B93|nr:permease [Pseudovibrio sp. M1P-2-3]